MWRAAVRAYVSVRRLAVLCQEVCLRQFDYVVVRHRLWARVKACQGFNPVQAAPGKKDGGCAVVVVQGHLHLMGCAGVLSCSDQPRLPQH
jgi:hypothetical protein